MGGVGVLTTASPTPAPSPIPGEILAAPNMLEYLVCYHRFFFIFIVIHFPFSPPSSSEAHCIMLTGRPTSRKGLPPF